MDLGGRRCYEWYCVFGEVFLVVLLNNNHVQNEGAAGKFKGCSENVWTQIRGSHCEFKPTASNTIITTADYLSHF